MSVEDTLKIGDRECKKYTYSEGLNLSHNFSGFFKTFGIPLTILLSFLFNNSPTQFF